MADFENEILNDDDVFSKKSEAENDVNDENNSTINEEEKETTSNTEDFNSSDETSDNQTESEENDSSPDAETSSKEQEENWKEKYIRLLAEFDNFRKRTDKEKQQMIGFGSSMILGKFLPLIDNIERAHQALTEEDKKTSMGEGLDKILKQLQKLLEDLDVKPIEALGKKFDPAFHNAVMTDEESDAEVDTITEELQKGYTYHDEVLRHTMVKVKK